ncbi:polysaccharide pyruvyl transferase family protein [Sphaerochaeta globosa]|uniref:Polysaccharide pyruvyl transferase n=1 Tax=Sphaerochaeta globosa (strain ATCC BAA-1886 / DSM 22777 / Buddy) TaxID=158189 RepID=F0RU21_SPHGB|nr:polysaccharide pyruvyl transferase family protein [Sphaerochaeta globosa]ADY12107.1 polysaccharide pyruvyl transferase [Sphaerochaeta globosa str. Buddy]
MNIKSIIKRNKYLYKVSIWLVSVIKDARLKISTDRAIKSTVKGNTIYYIGVPVHSNLGDQAQYVCIMKWLKKNYPTRMILRIQNRSIAGGYFSSLMPLQKAYNPNDIVIFQSGYTTTDNSLGDIVHKKVINALPDSRILMMPQTVYYKNENRMNSAAQYYGRATNMLFLSRDRVSYNLAKKIFQKNDIMLFPDIVTTLIGKYTYANPREGILLCTRNDDERYYSQTDISRLYELLNSRYKVNCTDTTKLEAKNDIINNPEKYILDEIEKYSYYRAIITDRYHGTIFSLIANTPVIILKTMDHKVITGAEWFSGIYDDYVFVADSIENAYDIANKVVNKNYEYALNSYFNEYYYDKLKAFFESHDRR